jgi:hypothetical protein
MSFEKDLFVLSISPSAKPSTMLIGALIKARGGRDTPPNLLVKVGVFHFPAIWKTCPPTWMTPDLGNSYLVAECSKTTSPCVTGIAVALGIVDVYDKNDHRTDVGCNF